MINLNDPLLFIDSYKTNIEHNSNQEYFDSRIKRRVNKAKYRIEDIEAMLYYRIHVLAEVTTKDSLYEGIVKEVSKSGILLQLDSKTILIPINSIVDINILRL